MRIPLKILAAVAILGLATITLLRLEDDATVTVEKSTKKYFREVENRTAEKYDRFEGQFIQFHQAIETNMALRNDVRSLFDKVGGILESDKPLTASEQKSIKHHFDIFRKNYEDLEKLIDPFSVYSNENVTIKFPVTTPSRALEESRPLGLGDYIEVLINPDDDLGRLIILEIKMWLAAKLVSMDNYVVILLRFRKDDDLRRHFDLSWIDPEAEEFLEDIFDQILDDDNFDRILNITELVQLILEHERIAKNTDIVRDNDTSYLSTLIRGSYSFHRIPDLSLMDTIGLEAATLQNTLFDEIAGLTGKALTEISEGFGNTSGMYRERNGKLYDMPQNDQIRIKSKLNLLDILFDKTPFLLTDKMIPGHWGHMAIWVGGKSDIPELKRLGVWQELPSIEAEARSSLSYAGPSFQTLIEQDRGVLEALRTGVELNTFTSFLNIDDLAVVRKTELADKEKKRYLLNAFAQIGKEYDFSFDVETSNKIVCSELAYVVYDDLEWPVDKIVGRYTVSPDQVAALALDENDPFLPMLLFHDGQRLPEKYDRENFKQLLKGEYDKIRFN